MNPSSQAQAVMLLTVALGKTDTSGAKQLSAREWTRLALWLRDHDLEPSALLADDLTSLLAGWADRSITLPRLESLLNRGAALGFALERWQRAGLWAMTRSDPDYPDRLKRRLRLESPPVLFGSGNRVLLGRGGIAVVGSRSASQDDIAFTENLGDTAAKQGFSIISGGARGIDQSAMLGALQGEGTAVGVMADGLLRTATSAKYRKYLLSGDLVLITPFNPEAGFNAGNAMSRNRYIYCLADAAVVVSSTPNKGGTWNGAVEDLEATWVPLWVKHTENPKSGNPDLVRRGASWLPHNLISLACLLKEPPAEADRDASSDPPRPDTDAGDSATLEPRTEAYQALASRAGTDEGRTGAIGAQAGGSAGDTPLRDTPGFFYTLFLTKFIEIANGNSMKVEDIASRLDLEKSQVRVWLKRGVDDGTIEKETRPVRYLPSEAARKQASLFGDDN